MKNYSKNKEAINEIFERTLKQCKKELEKKTESFISLGIQYNLPINSTKGTDQFYIEDFMDNIEDAPVALIGGPGVGKSTLLLKLSTMLTMSHSEVEEEIIPVFLHFGILNSYNNLKDKIFLPRLSKDEQEYLWSSGKLCIIFDGINEAKKFNVDQILKDVFELWSEYPKCKYIVSCRTLEFPTWASKYFEQFSVSPVTNKQIFEQFQNVLGEQVGSAYYDELICSNMNYLLEICRIPLLLSMVLRILQDNTNKKADFALRQLSTKSDIYNEFCKNLNRYQLEKDVISSKFKTIRDDLISTLAFYMQGSNNVFIDYGQVEKIIRNMKYSSEQGIDYINECKKIKSTWYDDILDDLKRCSYFNLYEVEGDEIYYCFIHQSFQEYFSGIYIANAVMKKQYMILDILLNTKNKRNWDTLEFASCLDKTKQVIKHILDYAILKKDPSALILASRCILVNERGKQCCELADDCCIWMLDAFKYWSSPYNYELIYAAQKLVNYTSTDFPERLKKDIYYFSDKYSSGYIATEYPESFELDYLKDVIQKGHDRSKLDAIYTLGKRKWPKDILCEVKDFLFSLLNANEIKIREQSIKAIKNLNENNEEIEKNSFITPEKMSELIRIISDTAESARIRTYALNIVAETGNTEAIEVFMNYLADQSNPYRDSASWSLQELLIKSEANTGIYDLHHMQEFYYNCLVTESDDETGMYSKGNLVYTLSKLDATDYVERLKVWLESVDEPYVQEDGINAIGNLAGSMELPFLSKYTSSSDPVIRAKAYEGMKLVGYKFSESEKKKIECDRYSIVNMLLKEYSCDALKLTSLEELMSIVPEEGEEKMSQYYEHVEKVININN